MSNIIRTFLGIIGGFVGYFVGGCDSIVYTLLLFVIVDYMTGVFVAITTKTLNSEVGYKGIAKKVCIFLLVGVGNLIDVNVLGSGATIRTAVIFFYLANEGISIIENAAALGMPIPQKLIAILEQLNREE